MPSDSGYVSISKNPSLIQWKPQHSLSLDKSISIPMSKHLHSTTRRIFIGPTPLNWSYKKSSLWFSKSDQAVHHKGPNRQRTFRAEPEVKGPSNMFLLDFKETPDDSAPIRISDKPFLVSEPEEMSESSSYFFNNDNNEVFYTPNEVIRSSPVTPNYKPKKWYSTPTLKNLFNDSQPVSYFNFTPTSIECISEEDFHSIISSNNNNHNEIENALENDVEDRPPIAVNRTVQFEDLESRPVHESVSIIKEERMLVRIERLYHRGTPKRYSGHFLKGHASRKYLAQSAGWKEYIVKLRPGKLELYGSKEVRFAKVVFTEKTRMALFSAIDYTITIKQQTGYGMKVIMMNPKTIERSIEWYRVLHATLGEPLVKPMPSICEVYVPDLDVRVRIPLEEYSHAHQITAEDITKLVLDELSGEPEWDDVLHQWLKSCDLRLCWKRYDRLEWIVWEKNEGEVRNDLLACPQFIEGTHQLQLRPTEHYPTFVYLSDGTKFYEPPPIEGYLIRVTNNKGEWKPKRLYFTSHDHYLFFLKPFKASPPPPPASSSDAFVEDQINTVPLIYAVAPQSQEEFTQSDSFMKADSKRRLKQIVNAVAFINLVDVVEVKIIENGYLGHKITEIENHGCPFELVLDNGRSMIIQAYSKQTMDEWIKRLNDLSRYWKARIRSDVKIRVDMFKVNEDYRHEDDDNTNQDELYSHWNNFQAYVNPTIWNWCILNGCRGITKGGLFYHKSHLHGTFRKYHHILTRGHLLYYNLYTRKLLDKSATRRSYYKRRGCINLADCYIYSGSITEYDLLYSSTSRFKVKNIETHKLPRIYSDGMYCYDNDEECTFVIWQGKEKLYFEKNGKLGYLKRKTMLDLPGNIWVFRTRSKIEREEWVCAINMEIERACKETEKK